MKNFYKYTFAFLALLALIIACTKEVGLYTEVEFEITLLVTPPLPEIVIWSQVSHWQSLATIAKVVTPELSNFVVPKLPLEILIVPILIKVEPSIDKELISVSLKSTSAPVTPTVLQTNPSMSISVGLVAAVASTPTIP